MVPSPWEAKRKGGGALIADAWEIGRRRRFPRSELDRVPSCAIFFRVELEEVLFPPRKRAPLAWCGERGW